MKVFNDISESGPAMLSPRDRLKKRFPRMLPLEERVKTFKPYLLGFEEEDASWEARRCAYCNVCRRGCPASLDIAGYVKAIAEGDLERALNIIVDGVVFPGILGNVCTRRCEEHCVYWKPGAPIGIMWLKGYVASKFDDYWDHLDLRIPETTKGSVAAVGAGPASLALGFYLRREGYDVTVYDYRPEVGGMVRYAIPTFRLPEEAMRKDFDMVLRTGIEFKGGVRVGEDVSFEELLSEHDAVFLGIGLQRSRKLGIPGEDLEGVYPALEFLIRVREGWRPRLEGKVGVIGGGDVAMDAARTAVRLGAEEVTIFYRRREVDMPAGPQERQDAKEEGVKIVERVTPVEFVGGPELRKMRYWLNEMVPQEGRRPKPVPIKDKVYEADLDYVIVAIGQEADYSLLPGEVRDRIVKGRWIPVDENGMTGYEGVFAGGDPVNDRGDVVSAVADAKRAVKGILRYLSG